MAPCVYLSACNASGLTIGGNPINGTIPSTISALTALQKLDLRSMALTGAIPSTIGNLTAITYLRLSNNALNSTLPTTLGRLSLIQYDSESRRD